MEERKDTRIGKNILVIFEDGPGHISRKTGVLTNLDDIEVEIDNRHIISRSRIIRMEVD
jgi:hypothetical protein